MGRYFVKLENQRYITVSGAKNCTLRAILMIMTKIYIILCYNHTVIMISGISTNIISIFIGGGTGAVLRYLTGLFAVRLLPVVDMPYATFGVNILGSFVLGFLFVLFTAKPEMSSSLKLALTVGFCGGLTTFSTLSLEVYEMILRQHFLQALLYVVLSLIVGVVAVIAGGYCAKFV